MAKTKHSAALFEVIQRHKPLDQQAGPGVLGGLSAWLQSRREPREPAPLPPAATAPPPAAPPAPRQAPEPGPPAPPPAPAAARARELIFTLSYPGAAIAALALITALATAFLAGRKSIPPSRPILDAVTTEQIRQGPVQLNVTDLRRTQVEMPESLARADAPRLQANTVPVSPPSANRSQPMPVVTGRQRSMEHNYVVIQSYPEAEKAMAEEAARVLIENGIDCTVEKGLPGWAKPNWYSVVGTDGFSRISNNPLYDAYTRKVMEISGRFAKANSFKAFSPSAYSWKRAE